MSESLFDPKNLKADPKQALPTDTLLVSFDISHGEDLALAIVGRKTGETITIVNAFQGEEAEKLFTYLTTVHYKQEV